MVAAGDIFASISEADGGMVRFSEDTEQYMSTRATVKLTQALDSCVALAERVGVAKENVAASKEYQRKVSVGRHTHTHTHTHTRRVSQELQGKCGWPHGPQVLIPCMVVRALTGARYGQAGFLWPSACAQMMLAKVPVRVFCSHNFCNASNLCC